MTRHATKQSPDSQPPGAHETTDASALLVSVFALGVAMMIALAMVVLVWTFWGFERSAERRDPAESPVAGDQIPPQPRLQTPPGAALARLRQNEDQMLSNYRWIDQPENIVQIPIDRAIDLLTERGLPEPEAAELPATPQEPKP